MNRGVWAVASVCTSMACVAHDFAASEHLAMANPAAVACASAGGTSVKTYTDKGEQSWCKWPSGQMCEEWAFFKGECPAKDSMPTPTEASPTGASTPTARDRK